MLALLTALLLLLVGLYWYRGNPKPVKSGWLKEAPDGRKWGHWKPSDFRYPHVTPADFDIATTKPVSHSCALTYNSRCTELSNTSIP
jgi:hypothetical protein